MKAPLVLGLGALLAGGCTSSQLLATATDVKEVSLDDAKRALRQNHDQRFDNRALRWEICKEQATQQRRDGDFEGATATLEACYPELVTVQLLAKEFEIVD